MVSLFLTRLIITACCIGAITSAPVNVLPGGDSKPGEKSSANENTDENSRGGIPFLSSDSDTKALFVTAMIVPVSISDVAGMASMMGGLGGLPGGAGSPAGALTSLAGPVANMIPSAKSAAPTRN
ncbi:uncharacterized protein LOC125501284 [Athalia rosae]|uniref:uncharacterized protein LOC125501284 n=1 Tax=Athalia rosae TaxID=37344 RepID=UPI0020339B88|nr:uncharacterized protein LOC125501284 [Athalia rosae]